jgi:hypothetical protein
VRKKKKTNKPEALSFSSLSVMPVHPGWARLGHRLLLALVVGVAATVWLIVAVRGGSSDDGVDVEMRTGATLGVSASGATLSLSADVTVTGEPRVMFDARVTADSLRAVRVEAAHPPPPAPPAPPACLSTWFVPGWGDWWMAGTLPMAANGTVCVAGDACARTAGVSWRALATEPPDPATWPVFGCGDGAVPAVCRATVQDRFVRQCLDPNVSLAVHGSTTALPARCGGVTALPINVSVTGVTELALTNVPLDAAGALELTVTAYVPADVYVALVLDAANTSGLAEWNGTAALRPPRYNRLAHTVLHGGGGAANATVDFTIGLAAVTGNAAAVIVHQVAVRDRCASSTLELPPALPPVTANTSLACLGSREPAASISSREVAPGLHLWRLELPSAATERAAFEFAYPVAGYYAARLLAVDGLAVAAVPLGGFVSVPAVGTAVTLLVSVMRAANLDVLVPTVTVDPACAVGHDVEVSAVPFELPESYRERLMSAADPDAVWYYTHAAGANQSVRVTVRADVEGRVLGATLFGQGENGTAHAIAGVACCVDQPIVIAGAAVAAWRYTRFYVAPVAKTTTVYLHRFSIEWEPVETGTSGHPHHAPSAGPGQVTLRTPFVIGQTLAGLSGDQDIFKTVAADCDSNAIPVVYMNTGTFAPMIVSTPHGHATTELSRRIVFTSDSSLIAQYAIAVTSQDRTAYAHLSPPISWSEKPDYDHTTGLAHITSVYPFNFGNPLFVPVFWLLAVAFNTSRTALVACESPSQTFNHHIAYVETTVDVTYPRAVIISPHASPLPTTGLWPRTTDIVVNDTVWLHVANPTTLGALICARTNASSTTVAERQFVWALNRVYAQTHQPGKTTPVTLPLADWTLADVVADTRELAAAATVLFGAWPADLPPDP